ncbi:Outer membrane protein assembly factor BamE, lipoprotein component of the BamABCDE complex [Burkholderia sp. D7]|nr:Outer membrane protein assembly factor BamE, lipoprotein component of the BamABCDE complex [Burkholderia sp. D7]
MNFTLRKPSRALPSAATLVVALLLSACGTGSRLASDGAQDQLVFPAPESASNIGGSYPLTEALRKLKPGMTKDQVASLLGRPQFQEGFFGIREWDYVLNVTNDAGTPQMVCQLKAVFTSHDAARNFYRKCGDNVETLADGKWQKYVVTPAAPAAPVAPVSTEASDPASSEAAVLTATPLRLEVVESPGATTK